MYSTEDFKFALQNKNHQLALEIIDSGTFDVRQAGGNGSTPLHLAAFFGNIEAVKALREKDACIYQEDNAERTPLHLAAMQGHIKIVKFLERKQLLSSEDKYGKQPLDYALMTGRAGVVEFLIKAGAPVRELTDNGRTALHIAISKGLVKTAKVLIKLCPNLIEATTNESLTPLHIAAANGHYEIAKLLLEKGADVYAFSDRVNTPLHLAAAKGHYKIAELLLDKCADIDETNFYGRTPLYLAATEGKILTVKKLLEYGANIKGIITERISSQEIKLIIKGLQIIESIQEVNEEPFAEEVAASILAFSQNPHSFSIIVNRVASISYEHPEIVYGTTLEKIAKIIDKAEGNDELLGLLSNKIDAINHQFMVIAEALANIITAKPMQIDMLDDIRSQKVSGIDADEREADEFLDENPFLKWVYNSCYDEERNIDPRNLDYYEIVSWILDGELRLERDGVELSLFEALNQTRDLVELGRHITALEQATKDVILKAPLESLLDHLTSHYNSLAEAINEGEGDESDEDEGDEGEVADEEVVEEASAASASNERLAGQKTKRTDFEARHQDSEEEPSSEAVPVLEEQYPEPEVLGADSTS